MTLRFWLELRVVVKKTQAGELTRSTNTTAVVMALDRQRTVIRRLAAMFNTP